MKLTQEQVIERYGEFAIVALHALTAQPTSRVIYPAFEPEHAGMEEYATDYIEQVNGRRIAAFFYIPEDADPDTADWTVDHYEVID